MKNISIILILLLSITFMGCEQKNKNSSTIKNNSNSSTKHNNNADEFTIEKATKVLDNIYNNTENINYGSTETLYNENDKTFYLFRITTTKETPTKVAGSTGYIKVYNDYSVSSVFSSYYDAINNIN